MGSDTSRQQPQPQYRPSFDKHQMVDVRQRDLDFYFDKIYKKMLVEELKNHFHRELAYIVVDYMVSKEEKKSKNKLHLADDDEFYKMFNYNNEHKHGNSDSDKKSAGKIIACTNKCSATSLEKLSMSKTVVASQKSTMFTAKNIKASANASASSRSLVVISTASLSPPLIPRGLFKKLPAPILSSSLSISVEQNSVSEIDDFSPCPPGGL